MKNFKRMMSLALALIMVVALVACGGDGGGNKEVKDTVNVALDAAVASSDPMGNTKNATMQTFQWAYESLVFCDGEGNIEPALATSWEVKNDGKDYVFQIRQGVKFHSGNTMSADDVVFSLNRACETSIMKNYVGGIVGIEKTGDWEVTVHLESPHNGFLYNLFVLKVIDQATVEAEGENFGKQASKAGTGPYMYKSYEPNTLVEFERFEDYWDIKNVGNIKYINAHIVVEASTRVTALQTGDLDFIPVPSSSWEQISKSSDFKSLQQEGNSTLCYIVNHYREGSPLGDIRVRQALKYAVDQDAIIRVAASGLGTKAEVMCNPTYIVGSNLDDGMKASFPYDKEKAKELLAAAGYPNGFTLEHPFLVPSTGDHEAVATMLQSMWKEIGVEVKIEMADSTTASAQSKEGYQDLYMTTSAMTFHMSNQKRAIHSSTLATQVAKYNSPELDSYLDGGEQALNDAERDAYYLKANQFLDEQAVNVPLYHVSKTYAWDPALDCPIDVYYLYVQDWNWT